MKKLFILILILFPLLVHGENLKLSELTAVTSAGVESEDLLLVTINPTDPVAESDGGTRASRKVTLGNLLLWIAAQTVSVGGTWTMTTPVLDTPTFTLADDSTLTLPPAASIYDSGLLGCATDGTCSWIDPSSLLTSVDLSSVTISGGTASRMAEWDGSGNLTSSDTATTGTGAPVKAVSPTLTSLPKVNITFSASNGTYSGTSLYFAQCAASMGFGQPAYIQSTGKPGLADADGVATMPAIGLVVVASTDADTPCTILTHGVITNTTWNWTTVGATIYVADGDAGALTATVGDISDTNDVVQVIGIALHADTIFVNPSLTTIVLE